MVHHCMDTSELELNNYYNEAKTKLQWVCLQYRIMHAVPEFQNVIIPLLYCEQRAPLVVLNWKLKSRMNFIACPWSVPSLLRNKIILLQAHEAVDSELSSQCCRFRGSVHIHRTARLNRIYCVVSVFYNTRI